MSTMPSSPKALTGAGPMQRPHHHKQRAQTTGARALGGKLLSRTHNAGHTTHVEHLQLPELAKMWREGFCCEGSQVVVCNHRVARVGMCACAEWPLHTYD